MSQTANAPKQSANEARAYAKTLKGSPRKLNLVAQMIRGRPVSGALADLTFCERRIANEVRKVLTAAIANAENNHNLDVDQLYVVSATVGRSFAMKRFHARGRGRSSRIEKPYSNLTVIVRERSGEPVAAKPVETKKAAKPTETKVPSETAAKAPKKASAKKTAAGE